MYNLIVLWRIQTELVSYVQKSILQEKISDFKEVGIPWIELKLICNGHGHALQVAMSLIWLR